MAVKSVYLPVPVFEHDLLHIKEEEHRHLMVARAERGEPVEIFDGQGNVWNAIVVEIRRRETVVEINSSRFVEGDPFEVTLGLAWIRSAAFELALEKAVEIGVSRIVPLAASRSNVPHSRNRDRSSRIIIEAAKQAKRYHLPVLEETVAFDEIVTMQATSKIMLAEHHGGPLKSALFGSPVLYLVGPEGGWTEAEIDMAEHHGFCAVSLGRGILRAETAAIVGGAIIRYEIASR